MTHSAHSTNTTQGSRDGRSTVRIIFLGLAVIFLLFYIKSCVKERTEEKKKEELAKKAYKDSIAAIPKIQPEFPVSGTGYATLDEPLKATFYPGQTDVRPDDPVIYVLARNHKIFFQDSLGRKYEEAGLHREEWKDLPQGEGYLIYPDTTKTKETRIYVKWECLGCKENN